MGNQFALLAKAKPASLHRLLAKLPLEDAAIVLTRLPDTLAFQVIAFFPDDVQGELAPAVVEARWAPPDRVEKTSGLIHDLLAAAKKSMAAKTDTPAPGQPRAPGPAADRPPQTQAGTTAAPSGTSGPAARPSSPTARPPGMRRPSPHGAGAPVARPSGQALRGKGGNNPYQTAADSMNGAPLGRHPSPAGRPAPEEKEKPGLAAKAREMAREVMKSTFSGAGKNTPKKPRPSGKPEPWVPRAATSSPINGPAVPGKPPSVSGNPFESPLAKAGLMDLIVRAQQTVLPKGTIKEPQRSAPRAPTRPSQPGKTASASPSARAGNARGGKKGERPEPREGVVPLSAVTMSKTPRVIGARPSGPSGGAAIDAAALEGASSSGARRMDGKAILAAILREAGPEIRGTVKHDDPALFKQLRERMFYFDDLMFTEDNALARVFTTASTEDAGLALKFAAPALRDRVLRTVSPGRARALRDGGTQRAGLDAVERAQQAVLEVALQLQAAGRILIDPRDPDLAGR